MAPPPPVETEPPPEPEPVILEKPAPPQPEPETEIVCHSCAATIGSDQQTCQSCGAPARPPGSDPERVTPIEPTHAGGSLWADHRDHPTRTATSPPTQPHASAGPPGPSSPPGAPAQTTTILITAAVAVVIIAIALLAS